MTLEDLNIGVVVKMKNLKQSENECKNFTTKVKEATESIKDKGVSNSIGSWNINFKKLRKTMGTFIGSLFTVRGIWFALRKSMTAYLAQNDELKNKLDGLYYAIGSAFAPLLEWMTNGLIQIIAYADIFAKAIGLAGINMDNFGKSASAAKKTLLGIDEINNLNSSSSGSSYTNPFVGLQLNASIKELLQGLGETVRVIFDTSLLGKIAKGEHLEITDWITLLAYGLGATAIGFELSHLAGNGTALTFTLAGIALATIALSTLAENADSLTEDDWKKLMATGLVTTVAGIAMIYSGNVVSGVAVSLVGVLTIGWSLSNILDGVTPDASMFSTGGELATIGKGIISTETTPMTPAQKADWELQNEVDKKNDKIGGKKLASFDIGTNYVPNDQLAMVHQGEAIVPKRFNSKEFFGQASVEELNLLSSINEQLEELNSKNYTIELDGENVAKKVSKSMQQLTNRNGVSVFEVAR